jgi:hypothetical protein
MAQSKVGDEGNWKYVGIVKFIDVLNFTML